MKYFNSLEITSTTLTSTTGALVNTLHSKLANGGRDTNCRFYYSANGSAGSLLIVATRKILNGILPALKDELVNDFNSLLSRKNQVIKAGAEWVDAELAKQQEEEKNYGKMDVLDVNGNSGVVYALDDWGDTVPESLMLGIEVDQPVTITQHRRAPQSVKMGLNYNLVQNKITTNTLVWFDTTALVDVSSDKNLISTRVAGRDYSRKELVSNGDIKFKVSGQITSGKSDIYPTEEMQKFYKVMQYKGIIRINNIILDQLGITHIVIENFNVTAREGCKSIQQYTFSAVGLQPEKEIEITEDTIIPMPQQPVVETKEDGKWLELMKGQVSGLKSLASDLVSHGLGLATGLLLNDVLDKNNKL